MQVHRLDDLLLTGYDQLHSVLVVARFDVLVVDVHRRGGKLAAPQSAGSAIGTRLIPVHPADPGAPG